MSRQLARLSSIAGQRAALLHLDHLQSEILQRHVLQGWLCGVGRDRGAMGRGQRIDPPLSGRRRHLAPAGRSQIGDLAVARPGESRVPFLLSKHCADSANFVAGLIMDATGNLYGATVNGGVAGGGGTLFELTSPAASGRRRSSTVLAPRAVAPMAALPTARSAVRPRHARAIPGSSPGRKSRFKAEEALAAIKGTGRSPNWGASSAFILATSAGL